ncbi:MAG: penicillin-insensitive murein endopeptidase [Pseudomonadota bacterium]
MQSFRSLARSTGLALLALAASAAPLTAEERPAKLLFGAQQSPAEGDALAIGSYARGCLLGAVELPESGPHWQAMRLSRNRNWAHPEAVAFVTRLARFAHSVGWEGLFIGDVSQPRGGPMLTGHRSHQIGLDVDIWMRPPERLGLSRATRETLSSISVRSADHRSVTRAWTDSHRAILRAAAQDPAVARIFVTAAAKRAMCEATAAGDRAWLRKIRPWWGHHFHFHVRLHCPQGSPACINQAPPPPGSGCDASLDWWFSTEALNPPPPTEPVKPRAELTMADLPAQCRAVLAAP